MKKFLGILVLGYLLFSNPSRAEIIFERCLLKPTYEDGTIFKIHLEKKIVQFIKAKGEFGVLKIDRKYGNTIYTGDIIIRSDAKQDVVDNFNKNFNFLHFFNIEDKTLTVTWYPKPNVSRKSLKSYKKGLKDGSIDEQVKSICKVTDVYKEIEAEIKKKEEAEKQKKKIKADKKWVDGNKPKLLKKVKAKKIEYDNKIIEINDDFYQLDTALKQYVNTFNLAKDGAEETFNITENKGNKDIKEKLKLLNQKKKLLLDETKIKKFESELDGIYKRIGMLEGLYNYTNIIQLKTNIDKETKSKNKIKGYEDDFNSLKSKKLGSHELENAIVQLNEEIAKEETLIKGSVISLKEEIDILDAELSKKKDLLKYLKLPIPFNPFALLQILKSISINKDF